MNKKRLLQFAGFGLLLIPLAYLAVQLVPVLFRGYETQTALRTTAADAVSVSGVVVRQEQPLPGSGAVLRYLVKDGSRVSPGAALGQLFPSAAQAQSQALADRLQQELDIIEQSSALAGEFVSGADLDQVLKQQQQAVIDLLQVIDSKDYTGLAAGRSGYLLAANRLQAAAGQLPDLSGRVEALTAQRDAALAAAGTPELLSAPSPGGYYSSMTDGLEESLSTQTLDEMDCAQLKSLLASCDSRAAPSYGKLIYDYQWYYYCVVPAASAQRFTPGLQVELDFDYTGAKEIPATVVTVEPDGETGQAKVKLLCNYINAQTVNLRAETARISFSRYSGIQISQAAVHLVEDENGALQRGVFVKYGNMLQFKQITPLYENEQYVIVPVKLQAGAGEGGEKNEVLLYDEIVVSGKDLYDGKLL